MNLLKRIPQKQRIWAVAGMVILAAVLALVIRPSAPSRTLTGQNILADGDFAGYAEKRNGSWYEDAYVMRSTYTTYDFVTEQDGAISAHIVNKLANDARFAQIVSVNPDSLYCLEGDIRADAQGGLGANLSVEGPYVFSESLYDQPEWKHVRLYGRTSSDQHSVTVFARLGGYSGEATGEAWFRNICLTEVSEVPEGYIAYDWYQRAQAVQPQESGNDDTQINIGLAGHALMMIIALAAYVFLAYWVLRKAKRSDPLESGSLLVFALFIGALLLRFILALTIHGYDVDVWDFRSWASSVVEQGPGQFYCLHLDPEVRSEMFICDYPPGYILVLGVMGLLAKWFELGLPTEFMIKLPPIIADLLAAWLVYRHLRATNGKSGKGSGCTAFELGVLALMLFNPMTLLTGACWGQSDSVMMLFLVLTLLYGMKKQWSFALPFYGLAVLMKPQALMFGPLGLVALYLHCREICDDKQKRSVMVREFIMGFVAMLVAMAGIIMPFAGNHGLGWLFELYGKTMSYYAYATVNACNLYFIAGANWTGLADTAPRWFGLCAALVMGLPAILASIRKHDKPRLILFALAGCAAAIALLGLAVPLTWQFWSTALMAMVVVLSLSLMIRSGQLKHLPLYGGMLIVGLFAMGGMMHERYLFPAVILLLWAWRIEGDDRILLCALLVTLGAFLNAGCVLSRNQRIGGSEGHLSIPQIGHRSDMAFFEYLSAFLNILAFCMAGWLGLEIGEGGYASWRIPMASPRIVNGKTAGKQTVKEKPETLGSRIMAEELSGKGSQGRLDIRDLTVILAITAAYAVLAFYNLGSMKSPQNGYEFHAEYQRNPAFNASAEEQNPEAVPVENPDLEEVYPDEEFEEYDFNDDDGFDFDEEHEHEDHGQDEYILVTESVVFDLGKSIPDFRMLYLGGVHQYDSDFTVQTSEDGEKWSREYKCNMDIGNLFQWYYVRSYRGSGGSALEGRYIKLTPQDAGLTLMEVVFRDPEGNVLPVASAVSSIGENASALIDEQDTLVGEPGWFNSMYFDEIYHARTGYEHLKGMTPYETTHPPLGKVLISWCIGIFGMTPFGWRFAGTLAGVLMLPGLYLTARQLFKKRRYAILCCLMLALDTLHYTQTRLATIDSYVVLFIIWSYFFMFRWMLCDFFGRPLWRSIIPLALSGIMMGLAVASKWTGCYAGVGLAILFFVSVGRRAYTVYRERNNDRPASEREKTAKEHGTLWLVITVASCLIWFVAIPAMTYYASYIPYFAPNGGVSLQRIINTAEGMLTYHSQPGLGMDHPYYSPWYEWPFAVVKPMYYAADSYEPAGYASSILAFGNISVWWIGFASLLALLAAWCVKQAKGLSRGYRPSEAASILAPEGEYDRRPLMLLISFAAQFLPWMLVPRGTYIYHYFPSVPFIILSAGLVFEYITDWAVQRAVRKAEEDGKAGEAVMAAAVKTDRICLIALSIYLVIVAAMFIAFFPYASGLRVRTGWLDAMNWFGNLYY